MQLFDLLLVYLLYCLVVSVRFVPRLLFFFFNDPATPEIYTRLTSSAASDVYKRQRLVRQRDALAELGVDGARPPIDLARSDPSAYVRALSRAGEAAELTARGGLGDFWWIVTDTRHGTLTA
ncbi:hypothetical protein AERO_16995 [Aeromicrobium fastidiosum]|uniref:hypothetical protein n=1 Tax=Aeromicrobium fastidiosum TaxID=52699 RepID=UPI0020237A78|nr:hypothetical protein [Aeromicrobium fastidiosum]MCL8253086.1 hypothetical protein [Aeromicrobium fastidiosum]